MVGVTQLHDLDQFRYTRRQLHGRPSSDTCHDPTIEIRISIYLGQEAVKRT